MEKPHIPKLRLASLFPSIVSRHSSDDEDESENVESKKALQTRLRSTIIVKDQKRRKKALERIAKGFIDAPLQGKGGKYSRDRVHQDLGYRENVQSNQHHNNNKKNNNCNNNTTTTTSSSSTSSSSNATSSLVDEDGIVNEAQTGAAKAPIRVMTKEKVLKSSQSNDYLHNRDKISTQGPELYGQVNPDIIRSDITVYVPQENSDRKLTSWDTNSPSHISSSWLESTVPMVRRGGRMRRRGLDNELRELAERQGEDVRTYGVVPEDESEDECLADEDFETSSFNNIEVRHDDDQIPYHHGHLPIPENFPTLKQYDAARARYYEHYTRTLAENPPPLVRKALELSPNVKIIERDNSPWKVASVLRNLAPMPIFKPRATTSATALKRTQKARIGRLNKSETLTKELKLGLVGTRKHLSRSHSFCGTKKCQRAKQDTPLRRRKFDFEQRNPNRSIDHAVEQELRRLHHLSDQTQRQSDPTLTFHLRREPVLPPSNCEEAFLESYLTRLQDAQKIAQKITPAPPQRIVSSDLSAFTLSKVGVYLTPHPTTGVVQSYLSSKKRVIEPTIDTGIDFPFAYVDDDPVSVPVPVEVLDPVPDPVTRIGHDHKEEFGPTTAGLIAASTSERKASPETELVKDKSSKIHYISPTVPLAPDSDPSEQFTPSLLSPSRPTSPQHIAMGSQFSDQNTDPTTMTTQPNALCLDLDIRNMNPALNEHFLRLFEHHSALNNAALSDMQRRIETFSTVTTQSSSIDHPDTSGSGTDSKMICLPNKAHLQQSRAVTSRDRVKNQILTVSSLQQKRYKSFKRLPKRTSGGLLTRRHYEMVKLSSTEEKDMQRVLYSSQRSRALKKRINQEFRQDSAVYRRKAEVYQKLRRETRKTEESSREEIANRHQNGGDRLIRLRGVLKSPFLTMKKQREQSLTQSRGMAVRQSRSNSKGLVPVLVDTPISKYSREKQFAEAKIQQKQSQSLPFKEITFPINPNSAIIRRQLVSPKSGTLSASFRDDTILTNDTVSLTGGGSKSIPPWFVLGEKGQYIELAAQRRKVIGTNLYQSTIPCVTDHQNEEFSAEKGITSTATDINSLDKKMDQTKAKTILKAVLPITSLPHLPGQFGNKEDSSPSTFHSSPRNEHPQYLNQGESSPRMQSNFSLLRISKKVVIGLNGQETKYSHDFASLLHSNVLEQAIQRSRVEAFFEEKQARSDGASPAHGNPKANRESYIHAVRDLLAYRTVLISSRSDQGSILLSHHEKDQIFKKIQRMRYHLQHWMQTVSPPDMCSMLDLDLESLLFSSKRPSSAKATAKDQAILKTVPSRRPSSATPTSTQTQAREANLSALKLDLGDPVHELYQNDQSLLDLPKIEADHGIDETILIEKLKLQGLYDTNSDTSLTTRSSLGIESIPGSPKQCGLSKTLRSTSETDSLTLDADREEQIFTDSKQDVASFQKSGHKIAPLKSHSTDVPVTSNLNPLATGKVFHQKAIVRSQGLDTSRPQTRTNLPLTKTDGSSAVQIYPQSGAEEARVSIVNMSEWQLQLVSDQGNSNTRLKTWQHDVKIRNQTKVRSTFLSRGYMFTPSLSRKQK